MVSIRYFLLVGELWRTKSIPLGRRTSNSGPESGACASKQAAQRDATTPALVNRAADNSNPSVKFSGLNFAKSVSRITYVLERLTSVRVKEFQIAASRIITQLKREHVPG